MPTSLTWLSEASTDGETLSMSEECSHAQMSVSLSRESSSNCFQHCSANIPRCWWHKETPTAAQGSSDVTRHGTVFSPLFFPFP